MPIQSIREKNTELERRFARMDAIIKDAPHGLSAEQVLAFNEAKTAALALKEDIEREQQTDSARADLRDLETFMNAPVNRLAHAVNADDEGRKSLLGAGWEVKAGMLYAPTSQTGRTVTLADGRKTQMGTVPMYPEDVVFGPLPDDPEAAAFYKRTRAILQPEYQPAYAKYLKMCIKTRSESMAWNMLSGTEQKALSEGADSAGGFVVPPDVMAEMLARTAQRSVMRAMCRVQATNRDILRWPAVAPNTGTYAGTSGASIYSSGFVGSWVGETPAFSDTDPGFQNFDIQIRKVRVATKLSNDFIADAAVNVLSWLAQNGGDNMALTEDQGFINGLGAALQPLGILNVSGITQTNVAGSTAHTISGTTSSLTSATQLIALAYALPAQYVSRARWLMARSTEGAIRGLPDGSGRFMWPAFTGSAFAGLNPTGYATELLGFPVMHSDWVPVGGTANNIVAVLGDFENYIIAQRTEITTVVLRERFADSDQTGIILFERVGGGAFNYDAFRIAYVS